MKNLSKELMEDLNNKWDPFIKASEKAGIELPDDNVLIEEMKKVFALSDFIAKTASLNPEMISALIRSGDLRKSFGGDEYSSRLEKSLYDAKNDIELGVTLRKQRTLEMVRIAWRDLSGYAGLSETMNDLSVFADEILDKTLSFLYEQHCEKFGIPASSDGVHQKMVVIGMGKLGGRELNFSSDVDLIFAYPETGQVVGGPKEITNEEFFTGLSRNFIKTLGEKTTGGIVFRVDMRLRPFGENGPLITNFSALEEYYQRQGREWERYAMIKARVVAGDKDQGNILLQRLKPFVYRRYLDYGVYESLREMKHKISIEVERKGLKKNIKLGPGGIREIEFFGQVFQLIRGGVEPLLQERKILDVLHILSSKAYIPQKVSKELSDAYKFLRNTEHRLQEFSDQQTHDLPLDNKGKLRLAISMNCDNWEEYSILLENHINNVHQNFKELLVNEDDNNDDQVKIDMNDVWQDIADKDQTSLVLENGGFNNPDEVNRLLDFVRNDSDTRVLSTEARERLNKLMPLVLQYTGASEQPDLALKRIIDLIKTIKRRSNYISLLLENQSALKRLVHLSASSPWIITFLARHPLLLDELLDSRTLYKPPERSELEQDILQRMKNVPDDDLEKQIEELIIFKNINILRVAAADVSGAFPLMKVSDYLSYIAEAIINVVLELSWESMSIKHGRPECTIDGRACDKGFAIIAYGKLGGIELGYGSDLDLVFLHAGSKELTEGEKPIDSPQFYSRLGQRIVHILTTPSNVGKLYEIDMRLRPSGKSGPLVSNIIAFRDYQFKDAWTWEHQALVRSRAICGDGWIIKYFNNMRKEVLAQKRERWELMNEISSMRDRIRKEHDTPEEGIFNIKHGKGGIIDIEFLVQYLLLLNAKKYNEIVVWSDNVRQLETLSSTGILDEKSSNFLKKAYLTYRSEVHKLSLQEKPAIVYENRFADIREKIIEIWAYYIDLKE
ncbi:MAG: bifunctional [glutamate--ammonia ligase]-adenylyl-L-tyrosine phosphorylase/[glutamate--ammonia-ligase] adenylyltransferase [Desulfobacterales bacterium]|nr:bifunctional [glutamate--ammonia ligase]-adenylyl-L-tyrosine phosphorylase/[glutamate--ammonia-ligase] adenylyltransferase [Desulfobacterales bacterium]